MFTDPGSPLVYRSARHPLNQHCCWQYAITGLGIVRPSYYLSLSAPFDVYPMSRWGPSLCMHGSLRDLGASGVSVYTTRAGDCFSSGSATPTMRRQLQSRSSTSSIALLVPKAPTSDSVTTMMALRENTARGADQILWLRARPSTPIPV